MEDGGTSKARVKAQENAAGEAYPSRVATSVTVLWRRRGIEASSRARDRQAAAPLLLGALPAVVLLRRRPPRIPDRLHAGGCVVLPCPVLTAVPARTP